MALAPFPEFPPADHFVCSSLHKLFLGRRFYFANAFIPQASDTSMPSNSARHLKRRCTCHARHNVQTSALRLRTADCFTVLKICASLSRLFFIQNLLFRTPLITGEIIKSPSISNLRCDSYLGARSKKGKPSDGVALSNTKNHLAIPKEVM